MSLKCQNDVYLKENIITHQNLNLVEMSDNQFFHVGAGGGIEKFIEL